MLLKEHMIPAVQWYTHQQNCQVGAKQPQGYHSSDWHYTDKLKNITEHTKHSWSSSAGTSKPAKFRNKRNSFPCLDCTLYRLFTGQKPVYREKHMAASWQEILLQKMWYLLKGSQSSTYSPLHWWLDWVIAHQLLTPTILVAGQVLSSRPAAHRALGPQGQELPVPPGQPTLDHHFPDCPTRICQTSWLKAQLEAEPPPPRLPQSVSEADLCEWSISFPLQCYRTCRLIQVPSL